MSSFEETIQIIIDYDYKLITGKKNNNFHKNIIKYIKICKSIYTNPILQDFYKKFNNNITFQSYNHLPFVVPSLKEIEERYEK